MTFRSLFLFTLLTALFFPLSALANTDILFIIDSSGSMNQVTAGEKQIDAAKKALMAATNEIPKETYTALRVYAHRVEQTNKEASCKDSELVIPFGPISRDTFAKKLLDIKPKGYTPIAYSLEQARNDFKVEREAERVIILLSDGEETCGGDPVATVKKLIADGFKVTVHTVGFNADAKTQEQLKAVAEAGNGKYFDAKNASELKNALTEATKQSFVIDKKKTVYGNQIRGGDNFETAVELKPGVEYRLDHHQKKGDYDYFFVDLIPGQEITAELKTLEKGISLRDGKETPTDNPYAGLKLLTPERKEVNNIQIIGDKFGKKDLAYDAASAGRYFVLLGSEYENINKDQVTFKVTLVAKGDADGEIDAGDKTSTAVPIEAKRYQRNFLGGTDLKDIFSFASKAGEQYSVGVIPDDDFPGYLHVRVIDDYKRSLVDESAKQQGEGLKTPSFSIPEDGTYFIEVSGMTPPETARGYILELKKVAQVPAEASTPAAP